MTRTLRFLKASVFLVLLLFLPGAAGQGSHGLSDHHAFLAGLSDVPSGSFIYIQLNHTYFEWGTIWYSARVQTGPPIQAFMVNPANLERFIMLVGYEALDGTADGPSIVTGGLGSTLPRGIYFLVLQNTATEGSLVKWEVFLDPRFPGSGGPGGDVGDLSGEFSSSLVLPLILVVAGVSGVSVGWVLYRRRH